MATDKAVAHYSAMAREARQHKLQTLLDEAKQGFDPEFEFSDDYGFWSRQSNKARTIRWATAELAKLTALEVPA